MRPKRGTVKKVTNMSSTDTTKHCPQQLMKVFLFGWTSSSWSSNEAECMGPWCASEPVRQGEWVVAITSSASLISEDGETLLLHDGKPHFKTAKARV